MLCHPSAGHWYRCTLYPGTAGAPRYRFDCLLIQTNLSCLEIDTGCYFSTCEEWTFGVHALFLFNYDRHVISHFRPTNADMGSWGTGINQSDDFFDQYNKGGNPTDISKKVIADNREILEIDEEKHELWFAFALAQWETKSLDKEVLSKVEEIISSDAQLKLWLDIGANQKDINKRKVALDKFLGKIKSERPKPKSRKRQKTRTPIFVAGECLTFKLKNGNYGGEVVIEADTNPETGYNLIAITILNQTQKPTLDDFKNAEVLVKNFGTWQDVTEITWYMPDLYYKSYAHLYENVGNLNVIFEYDNSNPGGKGYIFHPSYTAGWDFGQTLDWQLDSEESRPKPTKNVLIR